MRGSTTQRKEFANSVENGARLHSSSFDVEPCINQAVVDSNGVLYTVAYDNSSPVLAAYNGTTLEWEYSLPCGGNGCSWAKLISIEPTLASGQTTPSTDFSTYLYNGPLATGGSLAAYNNGLVVQLTNGCRSLDYNGTEANTEPSSLNLAPHYGRQFTATTGGRVFVPMKASSGTQTACGDQNMVGSIDAYDPGQSMPTWSFTGLPQCSDVYELHANYRGGVLMLMYLEAPAG